MVINDITSYISLTGLNKFHTIQNVQLPLFHSSCYLFIEQGIVRALHKAQTNEQDTVYSQKPYNFVVNTKQLLK